MKKCSTLLLCLAALACTGVSPTMLTEESPQFSLENPRATLADIIARATHVTVDESGYEDNWIVTHCSDPVEFALHTTVSWTTTYWNVDDPATEWGPDEVAWRGQVSVRGTLTNSETGAVTQIRANEHVTGFYTWGEYSTNWWEAASGSHGSWILPGAGLIRTDSGLEILINLEGEPPRWIRYGVRGYRSDAWREFCQS